MHKITSSVRGPRGTEVSQAVRRAIVVASSIALVAACGGGSDAASTTTTAVTVTASPTLSPLPTTTVASPATSVVYVTEGAIVGVANASRINGAATRMSDRLESVGFATGAPTNYPLGQIATTVVYFVAGDDAAKQVAESVREALGGGAITLAEMPTPPPTESGELGNVTVLIAMGNDVADKTLAELQTGTTAPSTSAAAQVTTTAPSTGTASSSDDAATTTTTG